MTRALLLPPQQEVEQRVIPENDKPYPWATRKQQPSHQSVDRLALRRQSFGRGAVKEDRPQRRTGQSRWKMRETPSLTIESDQRRWIECANNKDRSAFAQQRQHGKWKRKLGKTPVLFQQRHKFFEFERAP